MAHALLRGFATAFPKVRIDVFVNRELAAVVQRMPEVDQVIRNSIQRKSFALVQRIALADGLTCRNYQYAFVLPNAWKHALIPWFAKIPRRIGWLGESRYGLINNRPIGKAKRIKKMVHRYTQLLSCIAGDVDNDTLPKLFAVPNKGIQLLQQHGVNAAAKCIAIAPGAAFGPSKQWPIEKYKQLVALLAPVYVVVVVGSDADQPLAEQLLTNDNVVSLCGITSLDEVIDVISAVEVLVCHDSGLMHVACAIGAKVVALFGSTDPTHTPPLHAQARIIHQPQPCSPCFQRSCPLQHHNCMQSIATATVAAAVFDAVTACDTEKD